MAAATKTLLSDEGTHKGPFYVFTVDYDEKTQEVLMFQTSEQLIHALINHDKEMIKFEPSSVPLYDPKLSLIEFAQQIVDKSKIVMIEYKSGPGWVAIIEGGILIA